MTVALFRPASTVSVAGRHLI